MGQVDTTKSGVNSMTTEELIHWAKNALLFTSPAILIFLVSIQSGQNLTFALGAFESALLSALIGLIKTYLQNNNK